jgi:hypothetical protein
MNKELLHKIRNWFTLQKLRFDLGRDMISIMLLVFMIIAASDKIAGFLHITKSWWFVPTILIISLSCIWLWGYVMYHVFKIPQRYEVEAVSRSHIWKQLFEQLDRIERKNK